MTENEKRLTKLLAELVHGLESVHPPMLIGDGCPDDDPNCKACKARKEALKEFER